MNFDPIYRAAIFAAKAHDGQTRKYTGEPYIAHPLAVARLVAEHGGTEEMQAAAILHDVLEDTDVTVSELADLFPPHVVGWVHDLTDQHQAGNRAERKAAECERLSKCCAEAQTIKLCDLIDNTKSIVEHDLGFARVYLAEKRALVAALTWAWPSVRDMAWRTMEAAEAELAKSDA